MDRDLDNSVAASMLDHSNLIFKVGEKIKEMKKNKKKNGTRISY